MNQEAPRTTTLHDAAIRGSVEGVRNALRTVDINAVDRHGNTALFLAVNGGNAPVAAELLSLGADTEIANEYGNTPLWPAVMRSQGDSTLAKLLVEYGADPDHVNHAGRSPRDMTKIVANYDLSDFFD